MTKTLLQSLEASGFGVQAWRSQAPRPQLELEETETAGEGSVVKAGCQVASMLHVISTDSRGTDQYQGHVDYIIGSARVVLLDMTSAMKFSAVSSTMT